jgi:hypothetical protein
MGPRAALSEVLIVGALLLLVAIGFGIGMGNRVLGQVAGREPVVPTPVPIPTASPGDQGNWAGWKHISVMAVATDPAFPDPRIAPEPEVRSSPKPPPRPKPTASPTPFHQPYTSPPLPLPLVSHTPEGPGGESEPTRPPGRGPTPPIPVSSLNP